MIHRLSPEQINEVVSMDVQGVPERQRDEMAIPSYLHPNPLVRWLMWRRYECISGLARINHSMDVLEFGCGIGLFLPTLCKAARNVYAIDLCPQYAVALCDQLGLDVTFVDDLSAVPDGSVDVVVAADVLEHVDDLPGYIRILAGKLKPSGRLLVSGPTEGLVYKLGRLCAGFGRKGDYHRSNIDNIAGVIVGVGLRQSRTHTLPFRIPPFLFKIIEFLAE